MDFEESLEEQQSSVAWGQEEKREAVPKGSEVGGSSITMWQGVEKGKFYFKPEWSVEGNVI